MQRQWTTLKNQSESEHAREKCLLDVNPSGVGINKKKVN